MNDDLSYLQTANIVRLMSAARMAGLRWKSGTPGYDKAGIISKLQNNPSILRATVACLQRLEQGTPAPDMNKALKNSLLDDMQAEALTRPEEAKNPIPAPVQDEPPSHLRQSVDSVLRAVHGLSERVESLETYSINASQSAQIAVHTVEQAIKPIRQSLDVLAASIIDLQARKPVQFTIQGIEYKPVSGQHFMFPRLVKWLAMRDINPETRKGPRTHVLLVGPASSGKTTAALEFAKLKGLELYAQPLSMDSFAVVGYTSPNGDTIQTEFVRAWVNGGVYLWDEISMSSPEAIGTLNSALANGFIALPGQGTVYAHPDFYMIAGDNSDTGASLKYGARSLLDGASLDRFVRLEWNIDPIIEQMVSGTHTQWLSAVRAIRAEIDRRDIAHVGATMRAVITGCMALDSKAFTPREILEDTCKKGALAEQWSYFERLPAVQSFLRSV